MAISTRTRKPRRAEAQLAFEALYIEGGLLAPEWLTKVARLGASAQSEADYRVLKGLNLRDEIGRYWRVAQAHWGEFASGRTSGADPKALAERFVLALLGDAFGFGSLAVVSPVVIAERTYPIGHAALGGRVPVVIAPAGSGLDALPTSAGDGVRRRSAFGLAQEYLNAEDGALWGVVSDGVTIRIVRDNASLTRPAWIEADLGRIFTEERYADFAALWLLTHETRFGKPDQPVAECALEAWRNAGREEGTRAREHLRRGVEDALAALGHGFVSHPDNAPLRAALQDGSLKERDFFSQLLRLVYRLIFLLTVEERGLLHPEGTPDALQTLYADGYSLRRLRERSAKRSAHDRHSDIWVATNIVFRGVAVGEPRLGLPALAGIFAKSQCSALNTAMLENRALLLAVFKLSWLRDTAGLSRVNWRDMGPEELGSVYESLLELVPVVSVATRSFAFATGDETKGNARKTSGSYYTPDSLVQVLLDSALEPVIKETVAAYPIKPVDALLRLSIVDPACGSGHFLLAAARRLAAHVARLQCNGTPSAADYRHALRQVVGRCIYGVDLNLMAVELCKVALWMEAVEPGLPLTFLDAHIQHGNALLGTTPELMEKGIPNAAWAPISGDDPKVASALKKRNLREAGQTTMASLWLQPVSESQGVAHAIAELEAASDSDAHALAAKESRWAAILASGEYRHQRFVADAWCAAFMWPKTAISDPVIEAAPTMGLWQDIRDKRGNPPSLTVRIVEDLAVQYHFFHWHLAFPTVFQRGGFDVVLGNPPWERIKLQELEFFASKSEEIANAANAALRKKLINALPRSDKLLWNSWCHASREADGQSHLIRNSSRYPLCGRGDINTYALFAEHNRAVLGPRGRAGFIVPTGIATDDTTKDYFGDLIKTRTLSAFYGFENEAKLFKGIDHRVNFCLLVLSSVPVSRPRFSAFIRDPSDLTIADRVYELTAHDLSLLNPNTGTCPVFRSRRDASISLTLYGKAGVLWHEGATDGNPWGMRLMAMLHMANDSSLFLTRTRLEAEGWKRRRSQYIKGPKLMLPLYEAKMVYHFNHRYGDFALLAPGVREHILPQASDMALLDPVYTVTPRYWVESNEVESRVPSNWGRGWLIGWRDVTDPRSSVRTVIASLIPRTGTGDTFLLAMPDADPCAIAALYANLCSFALDYAARQKIGGTHLKFHTFKQLPVLRPSAYSDLGSRYLGGYEGDFLTSRVLELAYTAWDLEAFARDVGYEGPPFRWDPVRRFLLRCELDAIFFHIYGISRDDTDYILDTFPIVRKNDMKAHGEYRTKRVILEIYDAMADAVGTGIPYVTCLEPPPADPSVAHPQSSPSVEST
jgi:hypothetical protein